MNDKFDQLAKSVAESVTRRQAFKRFGFGLAAMAGFALSAKAECLPSGSPCGEGLGGHSRAVTIAAEAFPPALRKRTAISNASARRSEYLL